MNGHLKVIQALLFQIEALLSRLLLGYEVVVNVSNVSSTTYGQHHGVVKIPPAVDGEFRNFGIFFQLRKLRELDGVFRSNVHGRLVNATTTGSLSS